MLTAHEIKIVQDSFIKVAPIADAAATIFYDKLFEIAPEVEPMFSGANMPEQGKKLMTMIGTAVRGLTNMEKLAPAVAQLGQRHVAYGVKKEHFTPVGEALIYTLEKGLGDYWNEELKSAWVKTFTVLAETMIAAMEAEPEAIKPTFLEKLKIFLGIQETKIS